MAKVSLHVNILYRHATEEADGIHSTKEAPEIVKEFVFFISDYAVQDNDSVHKEHWNGHLQEFNDGCTAQYKSRHYLGDLFCCHTDLAKNTSAIFCKS